MSTILLRSSNIQTLSSELLRQSIAYNDIFYISKCKTGKAVQAVYFKHSFNWMVFLIVVLAGDMFVPDMDSSLYLRGPDSLMTHFTCCEEANQRPGIMKSSSRRKKVRHITTLEFWYCFLSNSIHVLDAVGWMP